MLEKLDLTLSLPKDEYKARVPVLQQRLFELQTACWRNGVGSSWFSKAGTPRALDSA